MLLQINTETLPVMTHFGYVSYKEPWIHFKRLTDEYIFYFIKNGELYIEEDGEQYVLHRGDSILLQPGLVHNGYKKASCDYFYMHFRHSDIRQVQKPLNKILDEIGHMRSSSLKGNLLRNTSSMQKEDDAEICYLPNVYHASNESSSAYLLFMLKEAVDDYYRKNEHYRALASCKLAELILRLSREFIEASLEKSDTSYPKAFVKCQALLDYLNNEYHQKISSHAISQRFETNYAYLNRVFHRMTGYTIFSYLNTVRIKKATELIDNTSISFSEVGYLVGINDPFYFSKLFKKLVGQSPTQYCKTRMKA
ncbi:MAG: helix-turn-helix domain-containing protein [Clostridia bacterium]|nr:helix-turn-helix domain-containing protein [Clostridia bacterium]